MTGATVSSPTWGSVRCRWDTSDVNRARRYQCHCCGVAAASTCINAFYSTGGRRKTAREGRVEQRAADGYLKILSLAEQEVQYNDAEIYNTGLDREDLRWGAVQRAEMPAKPAVMTGARCTRRTVLAPDRSPALVMVDGALVMAVAMLPGFVARLPLLLVSRLAVGAGEAGMTGRSSAVAVAVSGPGPSRPGTLARRMARRRRSHTPPHWRPGSRWSHR